MSFNPWLVTMSLPKQIDYLIVGLGNPGSAYEGTRHNIGFMAIETLAEELGIKLKVQKKLKAAIGFGRYEGLSLMLVQPLTYMNLSGQAVAPLIEYYELALDRLLIVYDDVNLPFGKLRLRPSGSAGGQNGMKSIIQSLGNQQGFPRLRLGIGPQPSGMPLERYVLDPFGEDEQTHLDLVLANSLLAMKCWWFQGFERARNQFNGADLTQQMPENLGKAIQEPPATEPQSDAPSSEQKAEPYNPSV